MRTVQLCVFIEVIPSIGDTHIKGSYAFSKVKPFSSIFKFFQHLKWPGTLYSNQSGDLLYFRVRTAFWEWNSRTFEALWWYLNQQFSESDSLCHYIRIVASLFVTLFILPAVHISFVRFNHGYLTLAMDQHERLCRLCWKSSIFLWVYSSIFVTLKT